MLTIRDCERIALDKCISMFGKEFVDKHKPEFSSSHSADHDMGMFEYSLLYAPLSRDELDDGRLLIGYKPFDYYASVLVDMRTGEVSVDPDESKTKLPD